MQEYHVCVAGKDCVCNDEENDCWLMSDKKHVEIGKKKAYKFMVKCGWLRKETTKESKLCKGT